MELSRSRALQAADWLGAVVLTIAAVIVHVRTLSHAGPLRRDDISSRRLATMPTLHGGAGVLRLAGKEEQLTDLENLQILAVAGWRDADVAHAH